MGLIAKDKGSNTPPVEAGVHHAICYGVCDLGTHYSDEYKKAVHKIVVLWELPNERITINDKDLPRAISKRFTLSLHKKSALRPVLESWRGRPFSKEELEAFDLHKMIGANCQISVIHNENEGNTYANVSAVMPLPKGMPKRTLENPPLFYSMEDSLEFPENMPDWIKKVVQASQEFGVNQNEQENGNGSSSGSTDGDDIPF